MARATHKINKAEFKKLLTACRINDVKVLPEPQAIPGDKLIVELDYRTPSALIDMGVSLAQVTGNEFDAIDKAKADKEKEKAKKAA